MNFNNPIKFTGIFLEILVRVLKVRIKITGEENIPKDKSILFCANHFTRFETMFMPYIFSKIKNLKYTRSLAYKDLFFGKIGEYLRSVKVVSTGDADRDKVIIKDLITGEYNWIIYPEGEMVKDKKIFTTTPSVFKMYKMLKFSARTGVASLAMRAELEASQKGKICICPITISYRPMHAKRSNLYLMIKRFINKPDIPKKLKSEIFFESSILSHSKILIHFHEPIEIKDYMERGSLIPKKLQIEYLRYCLTNKVMHTIYKGTPLTFDHFFSFCIFSLAEKQIFKIKISYLREMIFNLIATALTTRRDLVFGFSVNEFNCLNLALRNQKNEMLESTIAQIIIKGFGFIKNDTLHLAGDKILKEEDYVDIRLKNLFRVLFNEISYFKGLCKNLQDTFTKNEEELIKENGALIFTLLKQDYEKERKEGGEEIKNYEIGEPRLHQIGDIGVLLCHGFKSSPKEMEVVEGFLNEQDISTYAMRLKGHGTSPEIMKNQTVKDWVLSHQFASEAMFRMFKKVFVCGFSMGGLLSLVNASNFNYAGVISISAPLKVTDYKFYLAGVATEITSAFKFFNQNVKDFVLIKPEYPELNYTKTYFSSLKELNEAIKLATGKLSLVNIPALIIGGVNDDVVAPSSAKDIFNHIKSSKKELFEYNNKKGHVIVREENNLELLKKILSFVEKN